MRLLSTSEFAAELASPYSETASARSEIVIDGHHTGAVVTGAVLEAALTWQNYRIAFFTDDIPFEEMLRIYKFDSDLKIVDRASLGAMYSTGTFAELKLQPPNVITFRFFGGIVWRVVLLAEREFALPYFSAPSGVHRQFKFFRHFRVEGKPLPESARSAEKDKLEDALLEGLRSEESISTADDWKALRDEAHAKLAERQNPR